MAFLEKSFGYHLGEALLPCPNGMFWLFLIGAMRERHVLSHISIDIRIKLLEQDQELDRSVLDGPMVENDFGILGYCKKGLI